MNFPNDLEAWFYLPESFWLQLFVDSALDFVFTQEGLSLSKHFHD